MARVTLTCNPRPPVEEVTAYVFYQDGAAVGESPTPEFVLENVAAGVKQYQVSARNVWGESEKSAPISTPPAAGTPDGLTININVNVNL